MNKNPLEQQRIKIDAIREEVRGKYGLLFDNKDELSAKIDAFILQLDDFEKAGFVFNKEQIIKGLRESVEINDREKFIVHVSRLLEPLMVFKVTHSKIFEKVERETSINSPDNTKLSEMLYANFDHGNAYVHLATSAELIKEIGPEDYKKEIENGLVKLAEVIKSNDNVKEIWAISWILATRRGRKRLEDLGFTFVSIVSEEEKKEYTPNESRPTAKAFMKREDFLARYGNK